MKSYKVIYLFMLMLNFKLVSAQNGLPPLYSSLIKRADSLFKAKDYQKAAETFSSAFASLGGKGLVSDRYNSACAWAKSAKADSAFYQLFKAAEAGKYDNLNHLQKDADLESLHKDQRWTQLLLIVTNNKAKTEANYNQKVKKDLEKVFFLINTLEKKLIAFRKDMGMNLVKHEIY